MHGQLHWSSALCLAPGGRGLEGGAEMRGGVARRLYRPGKTVEVEVRVDEDCRIASARVTGDFFVYPEEALERVEESVRGCRAGDLACLKERILVATAGAEVLGFTWEWLAGALAEASGEACGGGAGRG